jgi:predicted nucleotidyltransferase
MLTTILGSATRARLLALLLAEPRREYHLREVIRLAGGGASSVQRDVERLEQLGLLMTRRSDGGRRLVSAAESHPLLGPLRALVAADAAASEAAAQVAGGAPAALHPALRPRLDAVLEVLRDAKVLSAVVFGSATQADAPLPPRDLDIVVRLREPARGRAARYFSLRRALEEASGLEVDLVEEEAVDNPYLRDEIARTGVTLIAAA